MSRVRLAGLFLFAFIPIVLVLLLRMPLGLALSIGLGVAIMLGHRFVARPFMLRHLDARCLWCGRDLVGPGVASPFRSGGEYVPARACAPDHARRLEAFARAVAAARPVLVALVLVPVAAYLVNAASAMAGRTLVPLEAARWGFKIPIAAAVVGLSFAWPLGRRLQREAAIDFPAHNLSLLGVRWTLWIFRIVGLFWLGQGLWALWSRA